MNPILIPIAIFAVSFIPLIGLVTVVIAFTINPVFGFVCLLAQLIGWSVWANERDARERAAMDRRDNERHTKELDVWHQKRKRDRELESEARRLATMRPPSQIDH